MSLIVSPPESVRGMKELNRNSFERTVLIPGLKVEAKCCSVLLKKLNKCLLNQPKLKNVVADTCGNTNKKIVLLNPDVLLDEIQEKFLESCVYEKVEYELILGYDFWTSDQVLKAVLPLDIGEITTAFESVGHIAHMNLREAQLGYKWLIGQVILDKNSPQIKTVVNKVNAIDETYRFFKMELLAGENKMDTTVKEHGCIFSFDFSKVYWNSRLQSEHKRLVEIFKKDDIVCDFFAGVGPFAIPAGKKGCLVYANDLNPESYTSLVKNCKLNHVNENVHCFNMDAREFLKFLLKKEELLSQKSKIFDHVIMNLPATAVKFLDVFKGIFNEVENVDCFKLPRVHCYCFSKAEDPFLDAKNEILSGLVGSWSMVLSCINLH